MAVDMNYDKIEITVPHDMVPYVKDSRKTDFERNAALLLPFVKSGEVSFGRAAQILCVNKLELIKYYGDLGVPYIDYSIEEAKEESEFLKKVMNKSEEMPL